MTKVTCALLILILVIASQGLSQAQESPKWKTAIVDSHGAYASLELDSEQNPHIAFTHWDSARDEMGRPTTVSRLDYAVWNGNDWSIQTVDDSGLFGILALDSTNRPHIVYSSGSNLDWTLKHAVLNEGKWSTQTVDYAERRIDFATAIDKFGDIHIIYTTFNNSLANNGSGGTKVNYAFFDGQHWEVQTIEQLRNSVDSELRITTDSQGKPYVLYLETVRYPYPTSVGGYSSLNSGNIKYAYLNGDHWQTVTLFTNSTQTSNLALNSDQQPSFCYKHEVYTVNLQYGSYGSNTTNNYAYWNGDKWVSQPINATLWQSGKTFLYLDASQKPQIFAYVSDYSNINSSGVMYTYQKGSSWQTENLGVIPGNGSFSFDTATIRDVAFNADDKLSLVVDGQVLSIGGADIRGGLTYATLDSLPKAPDTNWLIISATAVAIAISLAFVLIAFKIKKKQKETNPK